MKIDWPAAINRALYFKRFTKEDRILSAAWTTGPIGDVVPEGSLLHKLGIEFNRCVQHDLVSRAERCYNKIQEIKQTVESEMPPINPISS